MIKRLQHYLKTLDDKEKVKFFIYSNLIIIVFFGGLSFYLYKLYNKAEERFFNKTRSYNELLKVVTEAEQKINKKTKLDTVIIQKILSDNGLAQNTISINAVSIYNQTGFEVEISQVPSAQLKSFIMMLSEKNIYIFRYSMQRLPTTGNYNAKILIY